ncbi:hypothetical protein SHI21_17535 [Bacteriovorax sp. PP10]|uniref:Uncharacterized protein n=1 Tax=Bacteriovorax antarcticus TaxID=3088717 RepID=A0ABU5VY93_9BACT|nr:hypothetical protein [Bacteriovorax sp. PP10]MEA9358039.1 hypothetical protein [Bacteriovorax sp. PP10]
MKIFVNLVVLVAAFIPPAFAAETSFTSAADSLGLAQKPVTLLLDKSSTEGVKFSEATATGCSQSIDTFQNNKLIGWAQSNQSVSKFFTCTDTRNINLLRFSTSSCQEAIACRKNVSQMQVNSAGADKLMNEIVAKDYAKNILDQNSEVMDRLEILRQFAQKKFDIKGDKCNSRYQPKKGGVCNLSLLDEVFVDQQANCKFGNGCFSKGEATVLNFSSYKEKEKIPKVAFVIEYNEYRINEKVQKSVDTDSAYVNELAELVTSEEFKNANSEQKGDMFLAKMELGSRDRYKDPVLAYDFDSVSEKPKLKKMLKFRQLASIYENKELTKESFASSFNTFRKSRAEAVLGDSSSSCTETTDIKKICEDMTTLSLGKTLSKDSLSVEHLSSRDLKSEKDFERFKSFMGDTFNEKDYDTLVNARRCLSFGLASEEYNDMASDKGHKGAGGFGSVVGAMAAGPSQDAVDSTREKLTSYIGETPSAKSDSAKAIEPKLGDSAEVDSSASIDSALAGAQATSSSFANQFNQSFTPGAYGIDEDDKKDKAEKKEEAVAAPVVAANNAANDTKMTDLMKRLASAEEKVDKMKAANEEAENNRVKQKKIDEENALIKDLKGQIADLKTAKEKKESSAAVAVAAPVVEQQKSQANNVYASSYSNGSSGAPARQEAAPKAADNYDAGRASNSATNANSSSGRSGMNSATLTSSNNADNKVLPSGIVITTVDGMTTEKATQTISNRILELNGTPFYIEEGGMVKEIIAVVKDGKVLLDDKGNPIYEKIVKGKVGDKKFAKAKEKGRVPAAITDAADLKRDQEEKMKRERAEYLKLKNLTNGIIKSK